MATGQTVRHTSLAGDASDCRLIGKMYCGIKCPRFVGTVQSGFVALLRCQELGIVRNSLKLTRLCWFSSLEVFYLTARVTRVQVCPKTNAHLYMTSITGCYSCLSCPHWPWRHSFSKHIRISGGRQNPQETKMNMMRRCCDNEGIWYQRGSSFGA